MEIELVVSSIFKDGQCAYVRAETMGLFEDHEYVRFLVTDTKKFHVGQKLIITIQAKED